MAKKRKLTREDKLIIMMLEADLIEALKIKEQERIKYFARIDYNLRVHGSSKLKFDDIDYSI
jgi:hypothetical protein